MSVLARVDVFFVSPFQDHCHILLNVSMISCAPLILTSPISKTILIALLLNSINDCDSCGNMHHKLWRMDGWACKRQKVNNHVTYLRVIFGNNDRNGSEEL